MNTTSVGDVGKMHKDSQQKLQIWFDYLQFFKSRRREEPIE